MVQHVKSLSFICYCVKTVHYISEYQFEYEMIVAYTSSLL